MSRQCLHDLATLEPQHLRPLLGQLRRTGKLARNWGKEVDGFEKDTVTLPREHHRMALAMLRRLGPEWLAELAGVVQKVLRKEFYHE